MNPRLRSQPAAPSRPSLDLSAPPRCPGDPASAALLVACALLLGCAGGQDDKPAPKPDAASDGGAQDAGQPDIPPVADAGPTPDVATPGQDAGDAAAPLTDSATRPPEDVTASDAAAPDDAAEVADAASASDAGVADAAPPPDGQGWDAAAQDATGADGDMGEDIGPDSGPVYPKLALPACAANCLECYKCATKPICVGGKTYNNDCHAMCALQAENWPIGQTIVSGACYKPLCAQCAPGVPKSLHCAALKDGTKVTIGAACEAKCLELDPNTTPNPVVGACADKCHAPIGDGGGGCSPTDYGAVCSETDGQTYASVCAMQHCDMPGCFPVGATAKDAKCAPYQMKAACAGSCFEAGKWPGCPGECAPVCMRDVQGHAVSYRNGCVAKVEGAVALGCEGVSASQYDQCSAGMYTELKVGCCAGVDYESASPVCASKGTGVDAKFVTFRSLKEMACLTAGEQGAWTFQFQGPCLCNCTKIPKPVCGADGKTYENSCQAQCYHGVGFGFSLGGCGG